MEIWKVNSWVKDQVEYFLGATLKKICKDYIYPLVCYNKHVLFFHLLYMLYNNDALVPQVLEEKSLNNSYR